MTTMTCTTSSAGAVWQWGVQYRLPGDTEDSVRTCLDFTDAEIELHEMAMNGLTRMTIVSRILPPWTVAREGLAANVRELAEAYVDKQVDDDQVDASLNDWLAGDDRHPLLIAGAFQRAAAAVKWLRAAEDGKIARHINREKLVKEREELLAAAVDRVIGDAR